MTNEEYWILRIQLLVVALGMGLAVLGLERLRETAPSGARVVTCRELGKEGRRDAEHVRMTDFVFVRETLFPPDAPPTAATKTWIPVVPGDHDYAARARVADGHVPAPNDVRVVVGLRGADGPARARAQGAIEGIANGGPLPLEETVLLLTRFPWVDVDTVVFLDAEARPPERQGRFMLSCGILIAFAGLSWLAAHRRSLRGEKGSAEGGDARS